jgi:hypothetical protein
LEGDKHVGAWRHVGHAKDRLISGRRADFCDGTWTHRARDVFYARWHLDSQLNPVSGLLPVLKTVTLTVPFGPQTCRLGSVAATLPCAHSREDRKSTPYRNITRSIIIAIKNYPAREKPHLACHACPHPHLRVNIRKTGLVVASPGWGACSGISGVKVRKKA